MDTLIFWGLSETFWPMLVNEPAEYPELDQDNTSSDMLLHKQERNENALPGAPPPQQVVHFGTYLGQVCHLKWWLIKYIADYVDIFLRYAQIGDDKHSAFELKFHNSPNQSVFITLSWVGGTNHSHSTANHVVITQMLWILNKRCQAFAQVVLQGQNRIPHMLTEYRSWWLWIPCKWSPPIFWRGINHIPALLAE